MNPSPSFPDVEILHPQHDRDEEIDTIDSATNLVRVSQVCPPMAFFCPGSVRPGSHSAVSRHVSLVASDR